MTVHQLGIIGTDRRATALRARLASGSPFDFGDFRLAGTYPAANWPAAIKDPSIDALYLGCPPGQRAEIAVAALSAGKAVLAALPVAATSADLAAISAAAASGNAPLLVTSDLRCTLAGRSLLEMRTAGEFGHLHSIYLASRWSQLGDDGSAADQQVERLWEAVDFMIALAAEPPCRLFALEGRPLPGGPPVLLNARFGNGTIGTGEVGGILPRPAPVHDPETEIEVAGTLVAVRCEPYREAVQIVGGKGGPITVATSWHNDPVVNMLADLAELLAGRPSAGAIGLDSLRELIGAMAAVESSLAGGAAVRL
jgi:predicted dehydrogenase